MGPRAGYHDLTVSRPCPIVEVPAHHEDRIERKPRDRSSLGRIFSDQAIGLSRRSRNGSDTRLGGSGTGPAVVDRGHATLAGARGLDWILPGHARALHPGDTLVRAGFGDVAGGRLSLAGAGSPVASNPRGSM